MTNQYKNWHLETDDNNIVWCHLDKQDSSTNVLSADVLAEFEQIISGVEIKIPQGFIILSDKSNGFIAGADVVEFTTIKDEQQALELIQGVHALFNRLEALTCPTLSLINGFCLGGGLELALACRYRVALDDPKTRLGLPEVLLGIHPGFGGSMRMIRQIGPIQAMQLMLAGRSVDAKRAAKLGLVDRAVAARQLKKAAESIILKQAARSRTGLLQRLMNAGFVRPLLANYMRKQLNKRINAAHYPAPYALIELWEKHGGSSRKMLDAEIKSLVRLITSDNSRNLVRVFLLQDRLKSLGKLKGFKPQHVHVVGAGVMGGDIASWCAFKGLNVTLQDRAPEYIAPAIKRAHKLFKKRLKLPRLVTAAMDRLLPDHKALAVNKADVVIEAIIENTEAKIDLFKQIESRIGPDTILASNTSSIPLDEISQHLAQPERLTGIHFFNPVAQMQLVEIVYSENTAAEWIAKSASFCRTIDRLPLPVKSSPGFLVNRILTPYLLEAVVMLEEGIPAATVDKVAKQFGMPMGPVMLADTVGLDICLSVAENLATKINVPIPEKLRQMVKAGQLGKKSGHGFYDYRKGKPQKLKQPADESTPADLEDRLILRILNECAACLREQIVEDADLLDAGMIFGTGFAPFRGGPMHYAKHRGYQNIIDRLASLQQAHGDRFVADAGWQALLSE